MRIVSIPRAKFLRHAAVAVTLIAGSAAAAVPAAATVSTAPRAALAAAGTLPAAVTRAADSSPGPARAARAAHPDLTTDTPAACNKPQSPGHAQCFLIVRTPSDHTLTADTSGPPSGALGPADIQSAYNLPSATAGNGATVAAVDAYNDPNIASDLNTFRQQYNLPACTQASGCFQVVNQNGQTSPLPPDAGNTQWDLEESLDVEAISSACPNCHILLVEVDPTAGTAAEDDFGTAEDTAVSLGADYVSNSYGFTLNGGEADETAYDHYFDHPGTAITGSAGDSGYGVNWPSASQYVTAVGGTTLTKDTSVPRGWDETVWNEQSKGQGATGSGCSAYEPQPSWQAGTATGCAMRATADISADADPYSGLAVYDTYEGGGWYQVGGTSLSSPLIAASYALAGTPASGTYPASYLYDNYHGNPALFNDITSGNNGTCTPAVLCTAGPGWDGPTGLGTPDGVKGLVSPAGIGSVTGTVTDTSTGKPVPGATVSAPGLSVTTGSDGTYTLSGLPVGSYQISVSAYEYQNATATVTVTAGQAVMQNFALTGTPHETVSGTVTPATGTAWPLYAQVSWSDGNGHSGSVYTTPATGQYSLSLLTNSSYTLTVTVENPGYQNPAAKTVTVGTSNLTQDFTAAVDTVACAAIGYHPVLTGTTQAFDATSTPTGWAVTNTSLGIPGYSSQPGWVFNDPGGRGNTTGGTGGFAIVDSDHDGQFHYQDTELTSPVINMTANTSPAVQFATDYQPWVNSTATVDVSTDGGKTWTNAWTSKGYPGDPGPATVTVPLPSAAGKADVRVRFGYTGQWSQWWEIDNVFLGNRVCTQQTGGLLVGRVADSSGNGVNGAAVASVTNPAETATTAATPGDSSINGGLYDLFVAETGSQQFTASATGYTTATQTAAITAGQVSTVNFTLVASGSSAASARAGTTPTATPSR
jgi:hypothetical protein